MKSITLLQGDEICEERECRKKATVLVYIPYHESNVYGGGKFIALCEKHASERIDQQLDPEAVTTCPNCECKFGVVI